MSAKVLSTTNYSRFKFMDGNRKVNNGRVRKLIRSIKRKNMLAQFPIVCMKNCTGLYVMDGQHRLAAAKELKLEVYYIEAKNVTIEDVASTNSAQARWTPKDFISSYATLGNPDYQTLQEFINEFGLPASTSAALLGGQLGSAGNEADTLGISNGAFKVKDEAFARRVANSLVSLHNFSSFKDRGFVIAIARLMQTKQFHFARFTSKLEHQTTKLVKCATWIQYVEIIEDIYNWKTRADDMVPLVINVKKLLTK
jgi:hypothetical protein